MTLDKREGVRSAMRADQETVALRVVSRTFGVGIDADETAIAVLAASGTDALADNTALGAAAQVYHLRAGIGPEDAVGLIVNGYAREVLSRLPMEFAVEAQKLLQVSLEGSVG